MKFLRRWFCKHDWAWLQPTRNEIGALTFPANVCRKCTALRWATMYSDQFTFVLEKPVLDIKLTVPDGILVESTINKTKFEKSV